MILLEVGQAHRDGVRNALKEASIPIEQEAYGDGSTTTWAFLLNTSMTPEEIREIVWATDVAWVLVRRVVG